MIKTLGITVAMLMMVVLGCGRQSSNQPMSIPKVGNKAPDFVLPNDLGYTTQLSSFQGKKAVVLYFYPKSDTPLCSREAYEFTQSKDIFDSLGVEIIAVSVDGIVALQQFRKNFDINFNLLSDSTKAVCQTYGVLNEQGYANRTTFIIDKQGMIKALFENVNVDGHVEQVLSKL